MQAFFHIVLFIANLALLNEGMFYKLFFLGQVAFYTLAVIGQLSRAKNKVFYFPRYYCAMMLAQILGAYKELRGGSKATWEKAETTRKL